MRSCSLSTPRGHAGANRRSRRCPYPATPPGRDLIGEHSAGDVGGGADDPPVILSTVAVEASVWDVEDALRQGERSALLLDEWIPSRWVHDTTELDTACLQV